MTITRALIALCAAALAAGCATTVPEPRIEPPAWPPAPVADAQARVVTPPAAATAPTAPPGAGAAAAAPVAVAPAPAWGTPLPAPGSGSVAPATAAVAAPAPAAAAPVPPPPARADERGQGAGGPDGQRPASGAPRAADAPHGDLWQRVRAGFAVQDLDNELVRRWERWYAERPEYVDRMMDRGARYLFHIVEEVQERGLPMELALLPFIESAFNPEALSRARASGMWQFMPATGAHFDLKQNLFRDDRRSVIASTRAALDYLQMLHRLFGDWHLALAAYNWGQGNVQRAIVRNERARLGTGYTDLRMPDETRNYVPKLQAVKNIVLRPQAFGLRLPPLENHPFFLTVPVERDIDVALILKLSGLEAEAFRALNPQLNKPVVLAAATPMLLFPYDEATRFVSGLASHTGPLSSWTAWVAPRTMPPGEAARIVRMSESELVSVNRIPPRMLVRQGSTLLVRRTSPGGADVADHLADRARLALAPEGQARKARPAQQGQPARRSAAASGTGGAKARASAQASRTGSGPPKPATKVKPPTKAAP